MTAAAQSAGQFDCRSCGAESARWQARCPACSAWSTTKPSATPSRASAASRSAPASAATAHGQPRIPPPSRIREVEGDADDNFAPEQPTSVPVSIVDVDVSEKNNRILTGMEPLDRVLGGGIVVGSMVILGGYPGIGKSTLLMQMVDFPMPG